jgi:hypothetical protein
MVDKSKTPFQQNLKMVFLSTLLTFNIAVTSVSNQLFCYSDPTRYNQYLNFGSGDGGGAIDENAWARMSIPYFECDSEDFIIAYYFRWHMFHSHMNASGWFSKDTEPRYLITEFTGANQAHSGSAGLLEARV